MNAKTFTTLLRCVARFAGRAEEGWDFLGGDRRSGGSPAGRRYQQAVQEIIGARRYDKVAY